MTHGHGQSTQKRPGKDFVPEQAFPYRTATGAVLDSGRYAECLKTAMDLAGYEQLRKEQAELQGRPTLKRGCFS